MDGQRKVGPTQHRNSTDDRPLLDTSSNQKNSLRHDSTYAQVFEQASSDSPANSPLDADLDEEPFGSPSNSAAPQLYGSSAAKEYNAIAVAPGAAWNPPHDAAANERVTGTGHNAHDRLFVDREPVASLAVGQHTAIADQTSQSNGIDPQPMDANSDEKTSGAALMPPPTAPASMLSQLQPSSKAKAVAERIVDEAVTARLTTVCVILFRQGDGANAKKLAQFTVDLVGKQKWDEELPPFMQAPPLPDDNDAVLPLLSGVVDMLKRLDRTSSAFLEGMLYAWS